MTAALLLVPHPVTVDWPAVAGYAALALLSAYIAFHVVFAYCVIRAYRRRSRRK